MDRWYHIPSAELQFAAPNSLSKTTTTSPTIPSVSATSKDSRTSSASSTSSDSRDCLVRSPSVIRADRSSSPTTSALKISRSSISVNLPEKYDSSLEILRTFSSGSMQAVAKSKSGPDYKGTFRTPAEASTQIPRRNLTEAFEELFQPSNPSSKENSETPSAKQSEENDNAPPKASMISPTGVTELGLQNSDLQNHVNLVTPTKDDHDVVERLDHASADKERTCFSLHPSLQRDLPEALVRRVSLYAIIHDINKEAVAMDANDDSGYNRTAIDANEIYDPLVVAVNGQPDTPFKGKSSLISVAIIDEEQWLLDAVDGRSGDETRSIKACPPTFLQAMGEREYENPLASLSSGSRTQLWKPSRSWWEAKSGKNPWIEPKCHNKRWRYLWPLIHYHKFLARCIKKLKRNGIDVKTSVSPVSVFLREEVCAVSDHLAAVSLFDSDEWMASLHHFDGWAESSDFAEQESRELVAKLKLRPLYEPGDADSSLLRSQIDAHYLRAMASARAQLVGADVPQEDKRHAKEPMRRRESIHTNVTKPSSTETVPSVKASLRQGPTSSFQAHSTIAIPAAGVPTHPWQGYNPQQAGWWQNGWHPYTYGDDGSVQSALSCDTSFSHGYVNGYHPGMMHHPQHYYPPMMYPQHQMIHGAPGSFDPCGVANPPLYPGDPYNPQHMPGAGWLGNQHMGQAAHVHSDSPSAYPGTPNVVSPGHEVSSYQYEEQGEHMQTGEEHLEGHTPYRYGQNQVALSSPSWNHLQDRATLSMMGLSSPLASVPSTPRHGDLVNSMESSDLDAKNESNAQPLLLRQSYYGYGFGHREGYAPPSPATQFMMSPQQSFAYSYGYGYSPRRPFSQKELAKNSISEEGTDMRNDVSEGGYTNSETTTPSRSATKRRESPDQGVSTKTESLVSD